MDSSAKSKERFLSNFRLFESTLNGESVSPVHALRMQAIASLSRLDFPTRSHEDWKYTSVAPIVDSSFILPKNVTSTKIDSAQIHQLLLNEEDVFRFVFINNHFSAELSPVQLPDGVTVSSLAEALRNGNELLLHHLSKSGMNDEDVFTALNTAFLKDGAFIHVQDNYVIEKPIQLMFFTSTSEEKVMTHPRNVIVVGKNAHVVIIESYDGVSEGIYFTNAITQFLLGQNAVVQHTKVQNESEQAFHIASMYVEQSRSSSFTSNSMTFGGALVRNDVMNLLDGEGATCALNGLYMTHNKQHVDNHTTIIHAKPHCESHELYKGILDNESRGVFNGKIIVRPDAQKTDAKQQNKNLLLSDSATIDTKPQLEIFANDVRCTHGATVGQLDEEQLFYLRARGIFFDQAKDMLTHAFASEVVNRVTIEPLRSRLETILTTKLGKN